MATNLKHSVDTVQIVANDKMVSSPCHCLLFLVCRLDKLLGWLSTQASVVNFRYYLFCLCNVRRQYLLPGILGIYYFLTAKRPYLLTCKSSIYFLFADVTSSFWLALTQCWLNVVPSSMTLFQHWTTIVSGYRAASVPCKNETFSDFSEMADCLLW